MSTQKFDLVVLGGGPAGISGATTAATFDKTVALIERNEHLGGAGINTGTIPSKTLRESALLMSGWRSRKLLGLDVTVKREARLREFLHHERSVVAAERLRVEGNLTHRRVRRFVGTSRFLDPRTVAVTGPDGREQRLSGERILIATGSSPVHPPGFDFPHPRVHDSNEILDIEAIPRVLAVVGAGVIGSEYACTFAALGVEVHLIDGRDCLLPFLDDDLRRALEQAMLEAGVRFHWKERVLRCDARESEVRLELSSGAQLAATDVLVAAGRQSNTTEIDLEAAGIEPGKRGLVPVDAYYRTAVPHIYAAGDVVGYPALAGTSMEQARVAICHAFDLAQKEFAPILPAGIYTIPEISMVGETERSLCEKGVDYIVGRANYRDNARGQIIGDDKGFLKLLFRREDMRLLGVHALGEQASELVHVGLVAMLTHADADLFGHACFNYPTLGDLYKYAAYQAILERIRPQCDPETSVA